MDYEPQLTSKPKKRSWKRGGRIIVVGMIATGLVLGTQAIRLGRAYQQRQAVAEIQRLGGTVGYDRKQVSRSWLCGIFGVDLVATANMVNFGPEQPMSVMASSGSRGHAHGRVTNADLRPLRHLPHLRALVLWNAQVSDGGLVHIKQLAELRQLSLPGTAVTDTGLAHLKDLEYLRMLYLNTTRINGTGLVHLRELSNLHRLSLEDTQVTDATLSCVCRLPALTHLNLSGTRITNAGIEELAGLKNLQCLCIERTRVTTEGVKRLKQALPGLYCRGPSEDSRDADGART